MGSVGAETRVCPRRDYRNLSRRPVLMLRDVRAHALVLRGSGGHHDLSRGAVGRVGEDAAGQILYQAPRQRASPLARVGRHLGNPDYRTVRPKFLHDPEHGKCLASRQRGLAFLPVVRLVSDFLLRLWPAAQSVSPGKNC